MISREVRKSEVLERWLCRSCERSNVGKTHWLFCLHSVRGSVAVVELCFDGYFSV